MVALVDLAIQGIEHETVRAQLLRCEAVSAVVILVALLAVLVLAVLVRAIVRGVCNVADDNTTADDNLTASGNRSDVSGKQRWSNPADLPSNS